MIALLSTLNSNQQHNELNFAQRMAQTSIPVPAARCAQRRVLDTRQRGQNITVVGREDWGRCRKAVGLWQQCLQNPKLLPGLIHLQGSTQICPKHRPDKGLSWSMAAAGHGSPKARKKWDLITPVGYSGHHIGATALLRRELGLGCPNELWRRDFSCYIGCCPHLGPATQTQKPTLDCFIRT